MANKAERLLNLLAVLKETGRPLTASEIRERVPGYPDSEAAFKRSFERDKAALREMGIEVESCPVPASPEGVGYRVSERASKLQNPGLTSEEKAVMAIALGAISVLGFEDIGGDGDPARDVVYGAVKVGLHPEPEAASEVMAYLRVPVERLSELAEAMLDETLVEFEYVKADGSVSRRKVEPHGIRCVRNNWYLAARQAGEEKLKVFRIDRIRSAIKKVSGPRAFEAQATAEIDQVLKGAPWQIGGGEPRTAKVAVEKNRAPLFQRVFGSESECEDEAGRYVFEVEYTNPVPLLEAVCGFRDKAEILGPSELRSKMQQRLKTARAWLEGQSRSSEADEAVRLVTSLRQKGQLVESREASQTASTGHASRRREEAAERARRLVNLVPWLIQHPGTSLEEVVAVFKVPRDVLIRDLTMVTLTGVYPYLPHNLVDVSWSDGRVLVRSADHLESFANLTVEEGVLLYSALRAAAKLPGLSDSTALESGIEKLASALGIEDTGMDILPERASPEKLELLRKAIGGRETVEISYVSYSSETESRRQIDPLRLFVYDGRWYLDAYCHLSRDERIFRVSRIIDAVLTGRQFDNGGDDTKEAGLHGDVKATRVPGEAGWRIEGIDVEVVMPSEVASWFTRAYPIEQLVVLDNGWEYARLKASTLTWASRVLFGIVDRIVVLSPDTLHSELIDDVERALALYSDSAG